ncbi:MAG: phosphate acyltransferase PlsX [Proteobacteria bacterium]|nr:phosphate acyltransferase PlsX [Pseudomonadota bacterium]
MNASRHITIALDAMGGDHAPASVLEGAAQARLRYPNVKFIAYGDETKLKPILDRLPALKDACNIHHTAVAITNDEKPSAALRKGKDSSMGLAIRAVGDKVADGAVSAGNTGALMAISKFTLRTLEGIDRPAMGSLFPTMHSECVILDLGANVECDASNLFQFAVMGDAFARAVLGRENPRVGLLNIGSEDMKGRDEVKEAAQMLRNVGEYIRFTGYVEGNNIGKGEVDVIVADGFSGNIALKTAEGTAKICAHFLSQAYRSSWMAMLGYLFAKPALSTLYKKIDPRQHNGAMFLGLNGIVVKSHGGADAFSFFNAIDMAVEMIAHNVNEKIIEEIKNSRHLIDKAEPNAA